MACESTEHRTATGFALESIDKSFGATCVLREVSLVASGNFRKIRRILKSQAMFERLVGVGAPRRCRTLRIQRCARDFMDPESIE